MIRHVVLFQFRSDASQDARKACADGLAALPQKISQIKAWSQGPNVVPSDRHYDLCLVADFDSLEDLQIYQDHPAHQQVVQTLVRPIASSVAVVDFKAG